MKRIFFIRHGESEANAGMRSSDPALPSLTQFGMKQAQDAAAQFSQEPELIVTSSYIRTKQTARPLIERYPRVVHEEWPVHEFTYLSPSKCPNTTYAERLSLVTSYWERSDPFYRDGVGAESFADFMGRAARALVMLREREESVIAVFSHQQFIEALRWIAAKGEQISSHQMREYKAGLSLGAIKNGEIIQIAIGI
jgi:broad specificity phosphatase PhoE